MLKNIINLLGGLGLFLFGMNFLSEGLTKACGGRMKKMLGTLTKNRFRGFFLGTVVTMVIQSSSATTVMLMGFLNAGMMTLSQATSVIIGANIGTTITAVLIALDVSFIAPICIIVGACLLLFSKKQSKKYIGQVILGFGILFFGLKYMSGENAMGVLKDNAAFSEFIARLSNPFFGFLIGLLLVSLLQSSSAGVGIIQILALSGVIPIRLACFAVIGINLGSAMPLFLSAIGAKTNAKRAAFIYFIFDLVGTLVFFPLTWGLPVTKMLSFVSDNGSVSVALFHIVFKLVTALLCLPFVPLIVKLSTTLIKQKEHKNEFRFTYIDKKLTEVMPGTVVSVTSEVMRMAALVRVNLTSATDGFLNGKVEFEHLDENEKLINWLNHSITDYIVTITAQDLSSADSECFGRLFHIVTDLERIGDHAINISQRAVDARKNNMAFSPDSKAELCTIIDTVMKLFDDAISLVKKGSLSSDEESFAHSLENNVDNLTKTALNNHLTRLYERKCQTGSSVVYTKVLQDLERVGDHSYNIVWDARQNKSLLKQI